MRDERKRTASSPLRTGDQKRERVPASIGLHDLGGLESDEGQILISPEPPYSHWERTVHAALGRLVRKGHFTLDEHRRAIEALPPDQYKSQTYYEKWASGIAAICVAKGIFTKAELDAELGEAPSDNNIRFFAGDFVRVRDEAGAVRWRTPHLRTPGYIHGQVGRIERDCVGLFSDPEAGAFAEPGPRQPLYRVRFFQLDLWEGYAGSDQDTVDVDIFQPWLVASSTQELEEQRRLASFLHLGLGKGTVEHGPRSSEPEGHGAHSAHDHPHEHPGQHPAYAAHPRDHAHIHSDGEHAHGDHAHEAREHAHGDHAHEAREAVELKAAELEGDDSGRRRFPEAVIRVLLSKGLVDLEEIRRSLERIKVTNLDSLHPKSYSYRLLDSAGSQRGGSKLIARAWTDAAFKARLLEDGNAAAAELGLEGSNYAPRANVPEGCAPKEKYGTVLTVVENTADVHNVVVCTLCSCYPAALLGMSPSWYKSRAYRARAVRDPRGVLAEFGLQLPSTVVVRVHDSTADNRYLVLPVRPPGTEDWDEGRLASLVTRDCMIGVAQIANPS